ncbi:RNA polymerase sigma-70 factor (ECF subfamily) [Streptomyces sp. 2132.2]|uniref:sigma-70 family RNA polymerase sigma factor n=1 Tax=Streptomyces TaxID=1883 RepID=UPI000C197C71|nr:sigma-70 family RNA polymerase sigma factor [Streptomyces sp. 2132.2]ROQ99124.1 RNA polymerase sigma-70 factor (ECF subfamily) [Streptomyces sp. 2132.2]
MTTTTLCRRTDAHALARLHSEHGKALYGFLLGLTFGDRHRAEDLLQETLFRAWKHPEVLESGHASMRPWLYTVGRRLAIDARRARQVRPAEVGPDALDTHAPAAEDGTERAVTVLDVRGALRLLSPEHRAVLVQIYFRGASVCEAAEALGVPAGTVKSRTYYALRALREAMPGYGPGHGPGPGAASGPDRRAAA